MTTPVPFLDLRAITAAQAPALRAAFDRVVNSGWFILGDELAAFESEYATYCEAKHTVGVANGLDALSLGLRALNIGPGDEVIVPANTYIATWLAVTHVGAVPVPVEPIEATYNIDPSRIAAAITPATRAIMLVHLYGQSADLDPILALAKEHGLAVIEDAAQAHGAKYKGRRIGSHGDLVTWSFYPGKNLGALGDGGAVTTNNPTIADRLRVLRNYGSRVKYHNEEIGYNSRLDALQAAVLRAKLPHLESWSAARRRNAAYYDAAFADLSDVVTPYIDPANTSIYNQYTIRVPKRDALQAHLQFADAGQEAHAAALSRPTQTCVVGEALPPRAWAVRSLTSLMARKASAWLQWRSCTPWMKRASSSAVISAA